MDIGDYGRVAMFINKYIDRSIVIWLFCIYVVWVEMLGGKIFIKGSERIRM